MAEGSIEFENEEEVLLWQNIVTAATNNLNVLGTAKCVVHADAVVQAFRERNVRYFPNRRRV